MSEGKTKIELLAGIKKDLNVIQEQIVDAVKESRDYPKVENVVKRIIDLLVRLSDVMVDEEKEVTNEDGN